MMKEIWYARMPALEVFLSGVCIVLAGALIYSNFLFAALLIIIGILTDIRVLYRFDHDLTVTHRKLQEANAVLDTTKKEVNIAKDELDRTKEALHSTEREINAARNELNREKQELQAMKERTFSFISHARSGKSIEDILREVEEYTKDRIEGRYGFGGLKERVEKLERKWEDLERGLRR